MDDKKSFVVYTEWRPAIEKLTNEERGKLFLAMLNYADTGELSNLSPVADIVFTLIKSTLDRDAEKWENTRKKRAEAGKKGGRPKSENNDEKAKKANDFCEKQTKTKKAVNVNVNGNVNVNDNVNVNVSESDNNKTPSKHKYGEFKHVLLSDDQYSSLIRDFGESKTREYIKRVDEYCEQYGKSYKNYSLTIRKWISKDGEKNGNNTDYGTSKTNAPQYGELI
ncbi:MAG: hypothetical protein K2F81_00630 [Ruminococcus sp.]|nr:hypothetical protein [Ruminococcus sp.]